MGSSDWIKNFMNGWTNNLGSLQEAFDDGNFGFVNGGSMAGGILNDLNMGSTFGS